MLLIKQVLDILAGAGEKIIDAEHISALRQKPLAKVRAKKSCPAGHQNSLLQMHQTPI
jgi:hypothetical protein